MHRRAIRDRATPVALAKLRPSVRTVSSRRPFSAGLRQYAKPVRGSPRALRRLAANWRAERQVVANPALRPSLPAKPPSRAALPDVIHPDLHYREFPGPPPIVRTSPDPSVHDEHA